MSVLARLRKESTLEVYSHALKLRKKLIFLLLRDLGVKNKVRSVQAATEHMDMEDKQMFMAIAEKYGMDRYLNDYPQWLVGKFRNGIYDAVNGMVNHIAAAQSIWATNIGEAYQRRNHMNEAIAACEIIMRTLELAMDILPVNADKYVPYVEDTEKEIALLKKWRKSDNKRIKELATKQ